MRYLLLICVTSIILALFISMSPKSPHRNDYAKKRNKITKKKS